MSLAQEVQEVFRGFPFGAPATPEDIQLDGFFSPTQACFFWTLFGDACAGAMWGIKRDLPDSVIAWHPDWERCEVAGKTPLDAWTLGKQDYDAVSSDPED